MSKHRSALLQYLHAIWEDGVARMGGGLGILVTFAAAYFAFVAGHSIAFLWLLALISFLFAGYRVWLQEHRARALAEYGLERPKLTGFFQDMVSYGYPALQTNEEKEKELSSMVATLPASAGTEMVICVRLVNDSPTPTTLHNFSLLVECEGKKCHAPYAEESIIGGVYIPMLSQAAKARVNLVDYLNTGKQIVHGFGIDAVLVFHLPGFDPTTGAPGHQYDMTLTLAIQDAWGDSHYIKDWSSTVRPSLRLD